MVEQKYYTPDPDEPKSLWNASEDTPKTWGEAMVGRRIVAISKMDSSTVGVTLDDGTRVDLDGSLACCANYDVTEVTTEPFDGVIMRVEVVPQDGLPLGQTDDGDRTYRVFVYGQNQAQQQIAQFDGHDGTGYYGTGFNVTVTVPEKSE